MLSALFINAFITLIVIIDPIGTAAAFIGLTAGYSKKHMITTAVKAAAVAFGLLVVFGLCGKTLLEHLGITLPAFRIAGGLLLFMTASRMLFGQNTPVIKPDDELSDIAVFPLAIPLLAGPGCLTAIILLMSKTHSFMESATVMAALVVTSLTALACLLAAAPIRRVLGSGTNIVARVMGVILAAMSVQFVADGLRGMNFSFLG